MAEACVILNDIHIDIMDYIKPAYCNEAQVRVARRHVQLFTLLTRYCTVPKYVDRIRVGEQSQCFDYFVVSRLATSVDSPENESHTAIYELI
jgi:hypothetical protein